MSEGETMNRGCFYHIGQLPEWAQLLLLIVFVLLILLAVFGTVGNQPITVATYPPTLPANFRTGPYSDQFGQVIHVDASSVEAYSYDQHGGEWFEIDGVRFYRTPGGRLFRTEE
jgi:hypothetical protein